MVEAITGVEQRGLLTGGAGQTENDRMSETTMPPSGIMNMRHKNMTGNVKHS